MPNSAISFVFIGGLANEIIRPGYIGTKIQRVETIAKLHE